VRQSEERRTDKAKDGWSEAVDSNTTAPHTRTTNDLRFAPHLPHRSLISSLVKKAKSLVERSSPPEHTPSGRERWFNLGASSSYTVTAWVKFTDEMNTEFLSVRDDDGVRVRLTLAGTSWVAESFGVQGHKVEKIGEGLFPRTEELGKDRSWRLIQLSHKVRRERWKGIF